MVEERVQRRLAAILAADVAGYSRLMGTDEEGTLAALTAHRSELIEPAIAEHRGRVVKTTGDGLLAEFASVVDAVRCAAAIQRGMADRAGGVPEDRRIAFRMGVNLGDVMAQDGDVYGDGVNIAARIEGLAEPGGICVSSAAYDHVHGKLDVGFADLGEQTLKNIAEPVRVYRIQPDATPTRRRIAGSRRRRRALGIAALAALLLIAGGGLWWRARMPPVTPAGDTSAALEQPGKTSIALLPLQNLSGGPDQELFVRGLTADLNAALSKVPELLVIAQNSTDTYRDKTVDVRQVAAELGVRHVLEGSVQRSADRLRVTMQLSDGGSGANVWSERYDRRIRDLFALQDDIVKQVLTELQVQLTVGEAARIHSRGTNSLEAWFRSIQAEAEAFKWTPEANMRARQLYKAAADADPNWAHPVGGLAWTYREAVRRGWSKSVEEDRKRGMELARKAIEMDPNEPVGYFQLGNLLIESGRVEEGIALREKSVEIAPNSFFALAGLAWQLPFIGQEKRALELYQRAKRISPLYPAWLLASEGFALHVDGQHERAIEAFRESLSRSDRTDVHGRLAVVYADLGRMAEAREEIAIVLERNPNAKVQDFMHVVRFQDSKRMEWYTGLLRAAGLSD